MKEKKPSKKEIEALQKQLTRKPLLVWDHLSSKEREELFAYGERYKHFLDHAKTEREAVKTIIETAEAKGFLPLDGAEQPASLSGRYYRVFKERVCALMVMGKNR